MQNAPTCILIGFRQGATRTTPFQDFRNRLEAGYQRRSFARTADLKQRYSQRHDTLRTILKAARLKAGLKQQELSERLKRGKNFVSDIERGTRMLDVLEFIEYAEALGLEPRKLLAKLL